MFRLAEKSLRTSIASRTCPLDKAAVGTEAVVCLATGVPGIEEREAMCCAIVSLELRLADSRK